MEGQLLISAHYAKRLFIATLLAVGIVGTAIAQPSKINYTRTGEEVFSQLRQRLDDGACTRYDASDKWLKRYTRNPREFTNHLKTILPLLDYVAVQAQEKNLPAEFVLVPFIESWYDPAASTKTGPSGLWQMMPNTAKHFGIRFGNGYDGRFSPVDSTEAALNYLKKLQKEFKDWPTALMAYNAGDSRMRNSLKRQHLDKADAQNKLPSGLQPHTYAYIHKVEAISCLLSNPTRFGIKLPVKSEFTALTAVDADVTKQSLPELAESANISLAELMAMNPSYKNGLKPNAPNRLLLPQHISADSDTPQDNGN